MDIIKIKEARFLCSIGISKNEKKKKQELIIDLELSLDLSKPGKTDKLSDTIDYTIVIDQITKIIENNSFHLLEHLAAEVVKKLMELSVKKVKIEIKKPNAIKNAAYTSVKISRRK